MWWRIKTAPTLIRISESDTCVGLMEAEGANVTVSVDASRLRCEFGVRAELFESVCASVIGGNDGEKIKMDAD